MQEFTTVSSSSFDPSALAPQLTEKSADGWSVIGIVSTGSDVTAFLARDARAETVSGGAGSSVDTTTSSRGSSSGAPWSDSTNGNVASSAPAYSPAPAVAPEPSVSEPSGWAVAPEPTSPVAPIVDPAPSYSSNAPSYSPAPASAQPAVPAGWYGDPAGRFELRYWDGDAWTEHVSRAGQQYTDPPVA